MAEKTPREEYNRNPGKEMRKNVSDKKPMYSGSLTSQNISSPLFIYVCHMWFSIGCELYSIKKWCKTIHKRGSQSTWGVKRVSNISRLEAWDQDRWIFVSSPSPHMLSKNSRFPCNPNKLYVFIVCTLLCSYYAIPYCWNHVARLATPTGEVCCSQSPPPVAPLPPKAPPPGTRY